MLRRGWRSVAATTGLLGASGYIYYTYFVKQTPLRTAKETFALQVRTRGPDGTRSFSTRSFDMLPMGEVNSMLSARATAHSVRRPNGLVWRYTTAQLASNNPIEDAYASAIVQRDPHPDTPDGDLLFFAVMDGHSGTHTSRLLAKTLIPAVALELKQLMDAPSTYVPKTAFLDNLRTLVHLSHAKAAVPYDADPKYVSIAIQTAFAMLDSQIINAPLRLLAEHLTKGKGISKSLPAELPDLSQHPMGLASILPALSGSCALLTLLDTARRDLYVACTGDCRAVAGIWEEDANGEGRWHVEVLSEDQTGRNPKELLRVQSEHPSDEATHVIQRGRVLGQLEPTRAFGDARYKWPGELQKILQRVYLAKTDLPMRQVPPNLKTPPYVTPQPVVTHRKLSFHPFDALEPSSPSSMSSTAASSQTTQSKSTFRFIVLATDGLWDELSSADVVALVGGHLAGLRGTLPRPELATRVPTQLSPDAQTVEGKDKSGSRRAEGAWAFVDENVSTHLLRNAFGGADEQRLRRLVSIPAPLSRNYRDDVTVTVVWWEDGRDSQADTPDASSPIRTSSWEQTKAKL